MARYPAAYIRRSVADAGNPGDVSREVQERAVRELAHHDGHNGDVRLFTDWARSADEEKEAKRTEFRAMLGQLEEGRISDIYAYSLDRLARSTTTFARLLKAAKDKNVRVVTQREGDLSDNGNPMSWAYGFLVSFFAEFELRMAKARSQSVAERRHARGDAWGYAPFGWRNERQDGAIVRVPDAARPVDPVLQAYRDAGTVLGAARLLRERGIKAPRGGERWSTFTVARIIEHNAPELLPQRTATGRRMTPPKAVFAGLLRCHCGGVLTPNMARHNYYCWRGRDGGRGYHGQYNVQESELLPWAMAEAARLRVPDRVIVERERGTARDRLEGRRAKIADMFEVGGITRDEYLRRLAAVKAAEKQLDEQEAATEVLAVPELDWTWPPEAVNTVLRAMWSEIRLDASMHPVKAEWRVPGWRA